MRHPWVYGVFWKDLTRSEIPHPGHALFRDMISAREQQKYLTSRALQSVLFSWDSTEQRWQKR